MDDRMGFMVVLFIVVLFGWMLIDAYQERERRRENSDVWFEQHQERERRREQHQAAKPLSVEETIIFAERQLKRAGSLPQDDRVAELVEKLKDALGLLKQVKTLAVEDVVAPESVRRDWEQRAGALRCKVEILAKQTHQIYLDRVDNVGEVPDED